MEDDSPAAEVTTLQRILQSPDPCLAFVEVLKGLGVHSLLRSASVLTLGRWEMKKNAHHNVRHCQHHTAHDQHHEHHGTLEHAHKVEGLSLHEVVILLTRGQKYWVRKSNGRRRRKGGPGNVGSYFRERLRLEYVYAKLRQLFWYECVTGEHKSTPYRSDNHGTLLRASMFPVARLDCTRS